MNNSVKSILCAALVLGAVSVSWAERPTGTPDCEFDGGVFYKSNNTLYLESFNKDSATVNITSYAKECVSSNAKKPYKVIVERNTKLAANSTIVLPLDYSLKSDCVTLYEPVQMGKDKDGKWNFTAKNVKGTGNAKKPLLLITDTEKEGCSDIKEITFTSVSDLDDTPKQHLITDVQIYNNVTGKSDWDFVGTYSYVQWEEYHPDLGVIYGYAAKEKGAVKAGQFVKVGSGASVAPLRAYLKYIGDTKNLAKSAAPANIELPESIEVRLIDGDGELTGIAKWNMATGEITKVNHWFDLKGRKMNAKPENKGMFVGTKAIQK
ncbi:hypothetical protein [uncultured Fibrobacter sp.]|uniref:hypothetical protein n=1 Tax=uncultured Fibrobacter sp. TaxID=261512 RepID=UPI0025EF0DD7|nr:hypothetical protein [uncultured Fibrobacter sp.]